MPQKFSKLLLHPSFEKTVLAVNKLKITLPSIPSNVDLDFNLYKFPNNAQLLTNIEDIKAYNLNPKNGEQFLKNRYKICAYDESIQKSKALEGSAYLTSHSLVIHGEDDYVSSNYLTFYFYTRSSELCKKSDYIRLSENTEADFKADYAKDRSAFLIENTPTSAILFVDGPLIGGQVSSYTIDTNNKLLSNNIVPIFFVKNSDSNLVVENIKEIKNKYNSDLHWAYSFLKNGQRTSFFKYVDKHNSNNAKIFCYLKAFNGSPQRVEFHLNTFDKFKDIIPELMDLIYYLLLVQGNLKNPQVRSIAIAEAYARSTLRLFDLTKIMKDLGITPTINEERFK
ncbi:hypothetical protein MCMEM_1940 [Methanococcoides methylutens MM1]|uniref:NurA domain-containing protein n=2 Tax=Methanococcoides methylutens TaxID=2226 RepID=A0A0E3ST93_METMT|nr:hypothetical protein MCMEM_1940 [Methanococcoides methylutens MM1]